MSSCCMCRKQVQLEKCCISQAEMQNAHLAQLLHMRDGDLLVQPLPAWNRGAMFASVACVGLCFLGAAVFICGTEVQYFHHFHMWDKVLLVHMYQS